MSEASIMDWLLTFFIIAGIFFMFYTVYRQQSLLDTFNEIKEMFDDKIETVKDSTEIYK